MPPFASRRGSGIPRNFLKAAAALVLGGLYSLSASDPLGSAAGEELDFTNLSLEQLLETEITPVNVLGSHTHLAGEFMFGYRYSRQEFKGNRAGTREVNQDEVLRNYPLHHTWMTMEMHMFEVMYAPTDNLTLMGMTHYMRMDMAHIDRMGHEFNTQSSGLGDTQIMALYNILGDPRGRGHRLVLNGGISLPTGDIGVRYAGEPLEYSMQLGSGTFDLLPGITYLGQSESFSWGAQAIGTLRLGENSRDYRLGNAYQLGAWGYYKLRDWIGPSLRLEWRQWGDIRGRDGALNPARNPAFDADMQRGRRLDILGGINLYANRGPLRGLRFNAEAGVPVYQSLAGPNLEVDWIINLGVSYVFR